jgi:hypothetical protein
VTLTMAPFLIAALLIPFQPPAAAQVSSGTWYGGQVKPREIAAQPLVFENTFSIAIPNKWQVAPGHAHTIFSVVEKRTPAAMITLERVRLNAAVRADPDVFAAFKDVLRDEVQAVESSGKGFTAEVITGSFGQLILIQYRRPGVWGPENQVVQYLMPVGRTMYRLTCVAPASDIEKKYKSIFAWVAASFTPFPSPPDK